MGCESCSGGSCSTDGGKDGLPPGMLQQYDLNQSTADGGLVWIETVVQGDSIRISDVSVQLLGKLRKMSDARLFGVLFGGPEVKPLYDEIFSYGVDTLYHVRTRGPSVYRPEVYADCLADVSNRVNPAVILIGGTLRGREIAPRLAASLSTGLTADCTELSMDGRDLLMTRPAFGGNIIATISATSFPQMATVRPDIFPMPEPEIGRKGTVIYREPVCSEQKEIISSVMKKTSEIDISKAKVLISLGNGVRRSSVETAERIASKLGGMVSCSRSLVDKGWMPMSRQVGQSGRSVSPDIYIAFGISGSVQHKAGINSAKKIIAVNIDPDAPIKDVCDEFIVGDADLILEELDRRLS